MTGSLLLRLRARLFACWQRCRPDAGSRPVALEQLEDRVLLSAVIDGGGLLTIDGTGDSDLIRIAAGRDDGEVVVKRAPGVDGNVLFAGVTAIEINGLAGNDRVNVGRRIDDAGGLPIDVVIDGGDGRDRLRGGDGNDTILGGDGDDRIDDRRGNNTIDAGEGRNRVRTGSGNDVITAGSSADRIRSRGGNNIIDAGDGDNHVRTGLGDDQITTGSGEDRVTSRGGTNTVRLGEGDDRFRGGRGDDTAFGEGGDDNLKGAHGDDDLIGGDGNDDIHSGRGEDRVRGGDGKDRLRTDRDDDVEDEPEDEVQDENRDGARDRATVFGLGIDHTAALKGSIRNFNDQDWFRFIAEADGTLDLTVTSPNGRLVELAIEDLLQNALDGTDPGDGDNTASVVVTAGSIYFLRIEAEDRADGGSVPARYCVDLVLTPSGAGGGGGEPANEILEVEPNSPKASAILASLGSDNLVRLTGSSGGFGDKDFFLVPIGADGSLEVLNASTNGVLPEIDVEDIADVKRLELEAGATVGTIDVLAGEQLYVRVRAPGDDASDYQVDLSLTPAP